MYKKILVFGHSNIGDVIYDLAVVGPLRKAYPDSEIIFLTSARCRGLVEGYEGLDRVITFDRRGKNKGFLNSLKFTAELIKERADLLVMLKSSMNYMFLGVREVWRVNREVAKNIKHPVDRYLQMLRSKGTVIEDVSFDFHVSKADNDFCDRFLQDHGIGKKDMLGGVLLHAAWSFKSWPIEKWNTLAEVLESKHGIKLINLGKLPDTPSGRLVDEKASSRIIPGGETTLAQAKALLNRCRFFIGPDSSFLHLASCMGIETLGLYGPTPADRFYPYFHRGNVISGAGRISCSPCYPGAPSCRKSDTRREFGPCMEAIEVEDVLHRLEERLGYK